jgi:hypothetical protein
MRLLVNLSVNSLVDVTLDCIDNIANDLFITKLVCCELSLSLFGDYVVPVSSDYTYDTLDFEYDSLVMEYDQV